MIQPHGSDILQPLYVADPDARAKLAQEAGLPSLLLNSAAAANCRSWCRLLQPAVGL